MVFNATFNNISVTSWWSVLLVEECRVPRENHRTVTKIIDEKAKSGKNSFKNGTFQLLLIIRKFSYGNEEGSKFLFLKKNNLKSF
jgi:hypothetical protein